METFRFQEIVDPPSSCESAPRAGAGRRPKGTPVLFADGRLSFRDQANPLAANLRDTLGKVRDRVADIVLGYGGDSKGVDRLVASSAKRRKVPRRRGPESREQKMGTARSLRSPLGAPLKLR